MVHLVDTVAFVRYLEGRLPPDADRVFRNAEEGREHLLLPQIALAEFLYLAMRGPVGKGRPETTVRDVLHQLSASDAFSISSMPIAAWELMTALEVPELHDRMIAAEALSRGVPLLSSDAAFRGIQDLDLVW